MKRLMIIALLTSGAFATNFSNMSTQEMIEKRGSISVDDRPEFRQEMQKRMQSMTPQERQKYKGQNRGRGMGGSCMKKLPTFGEYDLNNDGKITRDELEEARKKHMNQKSKKGKILRNSGYAPAFSDMDKNKDGSLNLEEFRLHQTKQIKKRNKGNCAGNCPSIGMDKGQSMRKNFRNMPSFEDIDTNKDGVISKEEFHLHQVQRKQSK